MAELDGPLEIAVYLFAVLAALWILYQEFSWFMELVQSIFQGVIILIAAAAVIGLVYLYFRGGGGR